MSTTPTPTAIKPYLAHVRQNQDGSFVIHDLEDHLRAVAELAADFASTFGHSDWGHLAGRWPDLRKYASAFQNYIARESGFDPEAYIEGGTGRVNHFSAGALRAVGKHSQQTRFLTLAYWQ
jgi:CRISPR-associated endonuclease/helicase Cas3